MCIKDQFLDNLKDGDVLVRYTNGGISKITNKTFDVNGLRFNIGVDDDSIRVHFHNAEEFNGSFVKNVERVVLENIQPSSVSISDNCQFVFRNGEIIKI